MITSAGITTDNVDSGGETVLEDHEGSTSVSTLYDGDTGDYSIVTDSSLEGGELLETGAPDRAVGYGADASATSRGNEYKCQLINQDEAWFLVGVQDTANPLDNCYGVEITSSNDLILHKRSTTNGNSQLANVFASISFSDEYRLVLKYKATGTTDNLVAQVRDSGDSLIKEVTATDDEHTGGTFGFYTQNSAGDQFDYITESTV